MIPPIVREVEQLGSQLPTYVKDFAGWANDNDQFRELNEKYNITQLLSQEASQLPSKLGDAASGLKDISVGLLNNLVEAIVVLTLAYFLLLDGGRQFQRATGRCASRIATGSGGPASGSRGSSAPTSRSTSRSRRSPGCSRGWRWSCSGVDLAVPLAVLVAILDLVPLIGFTIGGLLVAVVAAVHDFPVALIVWRSRSWSTSSSRTG